MNNKISKPLLLWPKSMELKSVQCTYNIVRNLLFHYIEFWQSSRGLEIVYFVIIPLYSGFLVPAELNATYRFDGDLAGGFVGPLLVGEDDLVGARVLQLTAHQLQAGVKPVEGDQHPSIEKTTIYKTTFNNWEDRHLWCHQSMRRRYLHWKDDIW